MTPRTRSLYAYVGESHQPYQSPSKDLDMINGRISGRLPHVMGVQVLFLKGNSLYARSGCVLQQLQAESVS